MRTKSGMWTRAALAVGLAALGAVGWMATSAHAQTPTAIEWTTFVAGEGISRRRLANDDPGRLDLGESPWQCGYGRPRRAAVTSTDWSVQRVLACRRGEASVSTTASCRVHGSEVEERAATLSLGTVGESTYMTVTLSCRRVGR